MWTLAEQTKGFFNTEQKEQLTILFNALQPGDEKRKVPNAQQVGAVEYIDLLLERPISVFSEIEKWRLIYPPLLLALDHEALNQFKKNLHRLTIEEGTLLLTQLEQNKIVNFQYKESEQSELFDMLRRHCIQGCFCDPRWGGNTKKAMWSWYGYLEEKNEFIL